MRVIVEPARCPVCGTTFDPLRARAVRVVDGRVRAFCSTSCRDASELASGVNAGGERGSRRQAARRAIDDSRARARARRIAGVHRGRRGRRGRQAVEQRRAGGFGFGAARGARSRCRRSSQSPAPVNLEHLGLSADGTQRKAVVDAEPAATEDVWIHPLPGPQRRLPVRNTRRFGAAREGLRPEECEGGHCGVDLGSEIGELVMAAHDGVVERVVRDPNEGGRRGNEGRFIRISHKGGTIVTSYIHLDSIRDDLRPGVPVKVGEVIGQIGDSGVQHSGPHLHFAVSVRRPGDSEELFIDPEPMLHLWSLRPKPQVSARALHLSRNY